MNCSNAPQRLAVRHGASAPVRSNRKISAATVFPVDLRHDRSAPLFVGLPRHAQNKRVGSLPNELAQAIVELLDKLGQ